MQTISKNKKINFVELMKEKRIRDARRNFFEYCNLKAPDFYARDRDFLIDLCNILQSFYESNEKVLIVNLPPRHGKSRTVGNFVEWVLGNDNSQKIMTGSYNERLSTTFSKNVRNTIMETKADPNKVVYSDIFPDTKIKHGDGSMNMWSLEGGYSNYLATSPSGTATGFGASLIIIDDLIKNSEDAYNANVLEGHWEWFTNTMLSRLEEGGKIIIVMTRWHSEDLAGRALDHYGDDAVHITYKALQEDGTMLSDDILSLESYQSKIKAMGADIASANYQQEPIDIKGRLYTSLKTYSGELPQFKEIRNYTDTADTGDDYLCSINYGVTFDNEAYVLDVLYTKEGMEVTEPSQAKMLIKDEVNVSDIESNNGGRGYARQVERHMLEAGWNRTIINPFHQSKNKQARILSNATWVMEHIYFPENWKDKFPEFYQSMIKYQKEGKNKHDDAQDAVTGIAESIGAGSVFSFD